MNAQVATEPHAAQSFVPVSMLSKISIPQNIRRNVQKIKIGCFFHNNQSFQEWRQCHRVQDVVKRIYIFFKNPQKAMKIFNQFAKANSRQSP